MASNYVHGEPLQGRKTIGGGRGRRIAIVEAETRQRWHHRRVLGGSYPYDSFLLFERFTRCLGG
jgi:hypothetical protein